MDFGTYLKQELGYQSGQFIPQREAQALQAKYNKYIQDEEQKLASTNAAKARQAAADIQMAETVKQSKESGVEIPQDRISAALGLMRTGQQKEALELAGQPLAIKQADDAKRLLKEEEESKSKEIKLVDRESALRAAGDASYAITALNDLSMAQGFPGVFGAGVGFKYIPGSKTRDAESMRESVVALSTTDSIRKFQGLGSMSDKEFSVAQSAATKLKDPGISEELAAQEINRLRSYFANSIRRAEELGKIPKGSSEQMIKDAMAKLVAKQTLEASGDLEAPEKPLTARERLKAQQR
jgi:predicted peroxiredoxin